MPMGLPKASPHLLGYNDQNKVKDDFSIHVMPLAKELP